MTLRPCAHDDDGGGDRLTWGSLGLVVMERKWMAKQNRRESFVRPNCQKLGFGW